MTITDIKQQNKTELIRIQRFLLENQFRHGSLEILQNTAYLIWCELHIPKVSLSARYMTIADEKELSETVRGRQEYNVKLNYEDVRKSILLAYNYDIGPYYGVRIFVEQMSIIYSLYVSET